MRRRQIQHDRTMEQARLDEADRKGLLCKKCMRVFKHKMHLGSHNKSGCRGTPNGH